MLSTSSSCGTGSDPLVVNTVLISSNANNTCPGVNNKEVDNTKCGQDNFCDIMKANVQHVLAAR